MRIFCRFSLGYEAKQKLDSLELTDDQRAALRKEYGIDKFGYGVFIGDPRLILSLIESVELIEIFHVCTCNN